MSEDKTSKAQKPLSPNRRIYKLSDIIDIFSMSRSSIYRAMDDDGFPQPIKLTSRSIGWWRQSVEDWFANRPRGVNPCADADQYQSATYLTTRPGARDAA